MDGQPPDMQTVSDEESETVVIPPVQKQEELEENIYATLIGIVHDVRPIQTKSGGMMLIATLESAGFDFRLVIFSRDYEKYVEKIKEDRILVVDGRVRFDTERDEISVSLSG